MDGPKFHLAQGDAVAWLRGLPDESVDLVITDPPYESLEKHRAIGTTTRLKHSKASSNDWFSIFPNARFPELFEQVFRVLKRDSHFYLYCDPETMFVAKPLGEAAGFKFWKPLIWDKCLGPETPVWTARGVVPIAELVVGDRVAIPEGGTTAVVATRRTRAPSVKLSLSDGTELVASRDHRFVLADGTQRAAERLEVGVALATRPVRERVQTQLDLGSLIPDDEAIHESRAAAAHHDANRLLQNDVEMWSPRTVALDYDLGRFIGLFAAEGCLTEAGVQFAFHADEKHLHRHVARVARALGARARIAIDHDTCIVDVSFKVIRYLVEHFLGGTRAPSKHLKPTVYAAPGEFVRGVYAGLDEGDGSWSHDEQRTTLNTSSLDLAMFAHRMLREGGRASTIRSFDDDHAGGWRVRHDPLRCDTAVTVTASEDVGECDLVDVSIADRDELFLLGNGVVTHNCSIGMGYHYRARYECILFFEKGKRKLADLGVADILEQKRILGGYPAEKPPAVSEVLIKQSSSPGQLVIDPFMGSGSVGVAAATLGRVFSGNDLCREAVDITRARLVELGAREVDTSPAVTSASASGASGQLGLQM